MIRLENIRKDYRLGIVEVPVLRGVSLHIAEGEFVAVMGASGSGKSTLLNILGCLDTPSSGRYLLEGTPIDSLTDNALSEVRARSIGFVFQRFHLIKFLSVLDNTKMPMEFLNVKDAEADTAARRWLGRVRMEHRLDHFPHQLSGGERQRVAIARALIKTPKIILADEPTGNLDEKVGHEIIQLFRDLNRELRVTVIMVTHAPDIAAVADRTIHIRDGLIQ
ncbi:MAG: ABC transporter ATP-binding protein [Candidatus Riflebacteria bacterium]|nr:ABC transporter ATP-binding protein [Candidatus Riflebacteria bacterium]